MAGRGGCHGEVCLQRDAGGDATLSNEAARHLQSVLRVRPGDCVEAFDGQGRTRAMAVAETGKRSLRLVASGDPVTHEPPSPRVTLFAAPCKSNRMDWLVEKAVELGAWQITAVATERCVVKHVEKREPERWRRIAREALRQCGGAWEPEIRCVDFKAFCGEAAAMAQRGGAVWFGDLQSGTGWKPILPVFEYAWCVGPEGDFTEAETAAMREAGALGVSLGPRVLRSETAGVFGLCVISALSACRPDDLSKNITDRPSGCQADTSIPTTEASHA